MHLFTKRVALLLTAILLTIFTACKKDTNNNISSETVTTTIFGRVTDESGLGIYGAKASVGSVSVNTDVNGIFILKDVRVDKYHAFVKVSKLGYFDGSRTFIASANTSNNIQIKLIAKQLSGSFAASSGAVINVGNANVTFPADAIKNANGTAYTGTVNVYATFLDPTDANLQTKMPGDLIGLRTDNIENLLQTFGMMNVELEDASGNKLNLATGKEATLSVTVPNSLLSNAPTTIPMWYFDTETGLWKEEGTATLTGNKYIGNVKHFTFWNCDVALGVAVNINLRVVDENGNPIPNAKIKLTNTIYSDSRSEFADANGKMSGLVYADAVLKMEYQDMCGNFQFLKNIGPFLENQTNAQRYSIDIGDVVVITNSGATQYATYEGTLTNCTGTAITNGYVKYIFADGREFYSSINSNGKFISFIKNCNNRSTIQIIGYDFNNYKQSLAQEIIFSTGKHVLGNISTCSEMDFQFIEYQITGEPLLSYNNKDIYNNTNFYDSILPNNQIKLSVNQGLYNNIYPTYIEFIFSKNNNSGTYPITKIITYASSIGGVINSQNRLEPTGIYTTVNKFANQIGEYYEGSFSGNYIRIINSSNYYHPVDTSQATITCTYRIKRTQ